MNNLLWVVAGVLFILTCILTTLFYILLTQVQLQTALLSETRASNTALMVHVQDIQNRLDNFNIKTDY